MPTPADHTLRLSHDVLHGKSITRVATEPSSRTRSGGAIFAPRRHAQKKEKDGTPHWGIGVPST